MYFEITTLAQNIERLFYSSPTDKGATHMCSDLLMTNCQ